MVSTEPELSVLVSVMSVQYPGLASLSLRGSTCDQKMVPKSCFMLTTVQPCSPAVARAFSAPVS